MLVVRGGARTTRGRARPGARGCDTGKRRGVSVCACVSVTHRSSWRETPWFLKQAHQHGPAIDTRGASVVEQQLTRNHTAVAVPLTAVAASLTAVTALLRFDRTGATQCA